MQYKVEQYEGTLIKEGNDFTLDGIEDGASVIDVEFYHSTFVVRYYKFLETPPFSKSSAKITFKLKTIGPDEVIECNGPPLIRLRRFYAGSMYYLIQMDDDY